jgi:DNA-binding NtrC family response regulator
LPLPGDYRKRPDMPSILIIEEAGVTRPMIERRFGTDITVKSVPSLDAAWKNLERESTDVIICDIGSNATTPSRVVPLLQKFSRTSQQAKIFLIGDADQPDHAHLERFSCQWIKRPFDEPELLKRVEAVLERLPTSPHRGAENGEMAVPLEFEGLIAMSLPMRSVIQQVMEAAAVDVPVLISGETGTGKDLVAAAIHKRSKRKDAPYLPVNMGAITAELIASELFGHEKGAYTGASEGRAGFFEQANGGTIFLDEISTMDEKTQISLLRVMETKTIRRVRGEKDIKINVRVVAATNENIEEAVRSHRFREDLYYRLDVFRIQVPPLRERPGGVTLLTDHFVSRFDKLYKKNIRVVAPETYRLLRRYPWPGNVRELKNVVERGVLLAKGAEFIPDLLPARIREIGDSDAAANRTNFPIQLGMSLGEVEKEFIKMTLASVSGNKMKAAGILGVSRRALYNKLKRHGLL